MSSSFEDALRAIVRDAVRDVVRDELRAHGLGPTPVDQPAQSGTPVYVSTKQAAQIAGVYVVTIRDRVQRALLRGHRAGRLLRVDRAELIAMVTSARIDAPAAVNLDERAEEILAKPRRGPGRSK